MRTTKMILILRKDLQMNKGKYVAQGSHAALGVVLDIQKSDNTAHHEILSTWMREDYAKICVYVKSEQELHALYDQAVAAGIAAKLTTDNGYTQFHGQKTDTCVALLGTCDALDPLTKHLPLL